MTPQQRAEKIADEFLRWAHKFGSVKAAEDSRPWYESSGGACPDARIDRDGCRKWIIAALLAGFGVAEDSDDWYASTIRLDCSPEDSADEDWP